MTMRGIQSPEGDVRTIIVRHDFPRATLQDFRRAVGLFDFVPPRCNRPGTTMPCRAFYASTGARYVSTPRNGPFSADEANAALQLGPTLPGCGGTLRMRATWHDGARGQLVDVDVVAGRALVLPVTTSVSLSLLMPADPTFGAIASEGEGLAGGGPLTIVTSEVDVSAGWEQPNGFGDTQTLTDQFRLGPLTGEPPQPPEELFVPYPAFARRLRWDFGPQTSGEDPNVTANWAQWAQPGAPAGAILAGPVPVGESVTIPGGMQGVVFTGDPEFVSRVHATWELQL